ncbi:acyl-CoA thioesterase [Streptomyces sp. NPDC048514]|uniref:acyl-CoA thioesterase n=1 Tax=Streptomyces sp. NPDC048514 TaxID=3365564 RepID=UPI0037175E98
MVYPWHCDHMGHMNVMWYVGKFDEATWNLFADIGLTANHLRSHKRGMVAVEQRIAYRRELLSGDTVVIHSGIRKAFRKGLEFFHEMQNGATGEVAAVTLLTGLYIDTEARRSCPLPDEILKQGQDAVTEYAIDL